MTFLTLYSLFNPSLQFIGVEYPFLSRPLSNRLDLQALPYPFPFPPPPLLPSFSSINILESIVTVFSSFFSCIFERPKNTSRMGNLIFSAYLHH